VCHAIKKRSNPIVALQSNHGKNNGYLNASNPTFGALGKNNLTSKFGIQHSNHWGIYVQYTANKSTTLRVANLMTCLKYLSHVDYMYALLFPTPQFKYDK